MKTISKSPSTILQKKKVDLAHYNNDWYQKKIGASKLKRIVWAIVNVLFFINPLNFSSALKVILLRWFGADIGKYVVIKPSVNIKYPWKLRIGNHSWIGENVWIDNLAQVTISDHVCLSQGAMLLTGNHNFSQSAFDLMIGEIVLEEGVWICTKSIVCPAVVCKSHAVLGINSVASKNLEAYTIYRGNPAKAIKKRTIK